MQKKTVTIVSVGDIFLHRTVLTSGMKKKNNFDFTDCFALVKPYLRNADIATTWFEGAIDTKPPYTGYPRFKSPVDVAVAMKDAGFDVIFAANHVVDYGKKGLERTICILDSLGFSHAGAYPTEEKSKKILILEKDSVKVAFLSYTYGTNNLPVAEPYMVNLIDSVKIKEDIARAKRDADFVVVALHFGKEYERNPTERQQKVAEQVASFGGDFIVGSHCHVVQPADIVNIKEDGVDRYVFVAYCLGNFLCNQRKRYRDSGIMLRYVIEKDFENDSTYLKTVNYIPIWIAKHKKKGQNEFRVIPAQKAISNWEKGVWRVTISESDYKQMKRSVADVKKHINNSEIGFTLFDGDDATAGRAQID